jgi:hypothetical protein
VSLILGSPPGKVYGNLPTVASRMKERLIMRYDTLHSIGVGEGLGWFRNVIRGGVSSLTMDVDE